jgi:hypothetical protein
MVEEAISGGGVGTRARAERRQQAASEQAEQAASGQAELEVSRWLVALVGLGAVGVLVVFWGLAAWGLYMLFV